MRGNWIIHTRLAVVTGAWGALSVLAACSGSDHDSCGEVCDCIAKFIEQNPEADLGFTVCKPQCEANVKTPADCADFVAGRVSEEFSEDAFVACSDACGTFSSDGSDG